MHSYRSSFWIVLPIIGAVLGVMLIFGVVLVESVNAQECFSTECNDVLVSDGYWNNVWVDEGRWESVWVTSGYWNTTWVDTSHWQIAWVPSGYWQIAWVDTSHWEIAWVSSGYWDTVWVSGGSWDPCWIDTSYWSYQCTLVSEGYEYIYSYYDWHYTYDSWPCDTNVTGMCRSKSYKVRELHVVVAWQPAVYDCKNVWISSGYESMCWTSGGSWQNVWVDTSQYESTWVTSGYWGSTWVDTSQYESTWVTSGYWGSTWVNTSYWKSVWVDGGYWNNVWVDTSYWEEQCSTPPDPANYGDSCTSDSNSCGMTNNGVIDCNNNCSASEPPDSLCSSNSSPLASTNVVISGDNCGVASPPVTLSWTFSDSDSGDTQSAYRIRIRKGGSVIYNSGKMFSSSQQHTPPLGTLSYNTAYTWEVKVWDDGDPVANSAWTTGPGFTTVSHQYPTPSFAWLPQTPGENEVTSFVDTSVAYGGASISSWSWTFEDGTPSNSSQQNLSVVFSSFGLKAITLQVTDSSGFSCSDNTQSIGIGIPFPEWEEIPPFGVRAYNLFAGLFKTTY